MNNKKLSMEVDTGAAVSVISEATKATKGHMFPNVKLNDTSVILTIYTGEQMAVIGLQSHMGRKIIC